MLINTFSFLAGSRIWVQIPSSVIPQLCSYFGLASFSGRLSTWWSKWPLIALRLCFYNSSSKTNLIGLALVNAHYCTYYMAKELPCFYCHISIHPWDLGIESSPSSPHEWRMKKRRFLKGRDG